MNVPAVARKTFEELKDKVEYSSIVNVMVDELAARGDALERARLAHQIIDTFNQEVFDHPLVKELSPCKKGCSACCHTQVSVTEDEALLLAKHIQDGLKIDHELLNLQSETQDDSHEFFNLPYEKRRCIFLDEEGSCRVYEDRPSVCRTNAVLGSASQCDTSKAFQPLRLVKTPKADMVIYAYFLFSKLNGSLPNMVKRILTRT